LTVLFILISAGKTKCFEVKPLGLKQCVSSTFSGEGKLLPVRFACSLETTDDSMTGYSLTIDKKSKLLLFYFMHNKIVIFNM
jgi:hypothetical protein